jgi:chemotaxis protein CheD
MKSDNQFTQSMSDKRLLSGPPVKLIVVGMGEMIVSNDSTAKLVTYSLGSCIGISIYDPVVKVGGLLHVMLPDSSINPSRAAEHPFMFVDTGVPAMFHAAYCLGGKKARMILKLCGGATFLDKERRFNIAGRNVEAVLQVLQTNQITPAASETGGSKSRTVSLNLADGNVVIDSPGENPRGLL